MNLENKTQLAYLITLELIMFSILKFKQSKILI